MKKINVSTPRYPNTFTVVDDDDFEYLNQWKWHCNNHGYVIRASYKDKVFGKGVRKQIWMHRLVNKTPKGLVADHINRNKLDNRKSNIRATTQRINTLNTGLQKNNKSGYTGVFWQTNDKRWYAQIRINGKEKYLGSFKNIEDAARVRMEAETKYYQQLNKAISELSNNKTER